MSKKTDFDLIEFLPYLLNQAAEACSLEFRDTYRERYGMSRSEWRVLFHLGRYGTMTANEICARAKMHKTEISRAVQKLAQRRFLARKTDPDDRRRENLELTAAGTRAFLDLKSEAADYNHRLTQDLSAQEAEVLVGVLQRLSKLQCV
ncbi:MAG: helix-turn-helix domain-containing protein [Pseudomonadota bacterium]